MSKKLSTFCLPNRLSLNKLLLLILLAITVGCKKHDKADLNNLSFLDYRIGDSLFRLGNDSAYYYYNAAANNSSDRLQKARAYNRMAVTQFNSGDHFGSQETLMESQKLLDEKTDGDRPYLLSNYNLLGRSHLELKNYEDAITSFKKAEEMQQKGQSNPTLRNNLAVAYQKKKDYGQAKTLFQLAMNSSKKDTLVYARALSNFARTKWLEDSSYYAAPELLIALRLRGIKNERDGLKTSYSHLADYYFTSQPDSSLYYAKKMYQVAQNPDDILEAIQKITKIGSPVDAKGFSDIYYKLDDSLKQARNISRNQFAAIRYESDKNKADNLRLQRDNFKQRVYLYGIAAGFILLFALGVGWYFRRKRRIEQKSQESIREHQFKTSKKVHDVVANGLYQIMTDLEHRDKIDKDPLLDKIEVLYEQSRDISYDPPVDQVNDYSSHIHRLLSSFGTANAKVLIVGNQEKVWSKLSNYEKRELEFVLQELMVNMSKHSRAQNVVIKFSEQADCLSILYKDDGIGLSSTVTFGNGLRNTENRIKSIGGTVIFDGLTGLKIEISLPTGNGND